MAGPSPVERILEAARWAPSGDNAQPWRFRIESDKDVTVSIHCERGNVYEYRDGEPTLISAGTLLENIAIAAPTFGKAASWRYLGKEGDTHRIAVRLENDTLPPHPLYDAIWRRSVDRRGYRTRALTPDMKAQLTSAAGPDVMVEWHETLAERRKVAALTNLATDIRLRIPEAYEVHRRIVDWDRRQSPDGIPSTALGLDAMTVKMMRWSMASWGRTHFGNLMGSPFFAGLQMDVLPGIFSAAYFAFRMRDPARGEARVTQMLRAGQAVQRFWLTATNLDLAMQPCQAVLAFTHYGATNEDFTVHAPERAKAARLARETEHVLTQPEQLVFLARIGFPVARPQTSRSIRKSLAGMIDGA
jgi:nitroreductase